jgi:hypothetical protein
MAYFFSDGHAIECFWFFMVFDQEDFKMKFFYQSVALSIVFTILWIFEEQLPFPLHRDSPGIIGFFFIQSMIMSWLFVKARKKVDKFVVYSLGATVFRLLTAVLLLIFFLLIKDQNFKLLSFEIIVLYLAHLIFELRYVWFNLQRN